ncbi:MAG: ATP-binding protein [Myxococcota bacterium]|nr:ATP-binding protein [Myxococcota bacterium]
MPKSDLPRAKDLPSWIKTLKARYLTTETGQFIVHGNVHDLVYCDGQSWSMSHFLSTFFTPSGKLVVHYDPGHGVWFDSADGALRAAQIWVDANFIDAKSIAPAGFERTSAASIQKRLRREIGLERSPEIVLEALEVLLTAESDSVAVIIHYAELIAPDGPISGLSFPDRTAAARLHRWSHSEQIISKDNIVVLLTSALPDLAKRLSRNPRVASLHIPHPNLGSRRAFLTHISPVLATDQLDTYSRVTAGLQLRQIQDVLGRQQDTGDQQSDHVSMTLADIRARKKEILEQECFGLIEVLEPKYGFESVGGNEGIKAALNRVASHIKAGRRTQVPMGVLCVGPMGTGKTFITKAFAKESGLAAVQLKNFRDKWVGSTEANLETVLNVIEAIGEIIVIIDEGDRSLGGGDSDGGVNSRVMARLKEFMSDTSHRGQIVFFMMTNRPDKLDTDMKRPGRFDLKIPFFPPQTAEERGQLLDAVAKRYDIELPANHKRILEILTPLDGYAAADLEAIVLMAFDEQQHASKSESRRKLTLKHLSSAAENFMPTRETSMIEYMKLLAIYEASNRKLLPEQYRAIEVETLHEKLREMRMALAQERLGV